jgi:hypothetical protein
MFGIDTPLWSFSHHPFPKRTSTPCNIPLFIAVDGDVQQRPVKFAFVIAALVSCPEVV